jgi:DNA polymerase I
MQGRPRGPRRLAGASGTGEPETSPPVTTLFEPGADDVLFVLDLSGYVFRAYHALPPLSNSKGEPTHAVHGVASMLHKLLREQRPRRIVVALEGRGPSIRRQRFEAYKATRKEHPPDLRQQFERVLQVVDALRLPSLGVAGYEADDVIAALVKRAREEGMRAVIVSADKDLLQLVDHDVVMYDTMRERVFGSEETQAKMGVPPSQIRDLLALQGDSIDNIPGVRGVGPKTAVALLTRFGDLDGIYAHLGEVEKKGVRAKLEEHRESALMSRELVTLCDDVPLPVDVSALAYDGPDLARLRALYGELELTRLLAQLEVEQPAAASPASEAHVLVQDVAAVREAVREAMTRPAVGVFTAVDGDDPMRGTLAGVGLSWVSGAGCYIPLDHGGGADASERLEALRLLWESGGHRVVSSDVKRDEVALAKHGIAVREPAFDTMLASYLLDAGRHAHGLADVARTELQIDLQSYDGLTEKRRGVQLALLDVTTEKSGPWAARRADVTLRVAAAQRERIAKEGFHSLLHDLEIPLAHVLADMERTGIRLDCDRLGELALDVDGQMAALETRCTDLAGRAFNVGSPRQLETILFDELGLRAIKRTKTARSTDADVLEELAAEHPLPATILEHRTLSKLKGTYLDALPRVVHPQTGRVHTRFNQAVAATGRLSSSEPNLQNIPIRHELGRQIRTAFIAREGWRILSADYSQIELRVLAHLSRDPELCEAFAGGTDVHTRTATSLFGVTPENVTREMRGRAKTVNFAVIYGQTQFALARNLGIERSEAKRYIDAFFERYAGVRRYMEAVVEEARRTGEVRTVLGRRRQLPDLGSRNRQLRAAAERMACNTPIQGSAADIMKRAMVNIHRAMGAAGMRAKLLLTVHDELVLEAPPEEETTLEALVRERMESALELTVPLVVELGWGRSWGEAH